MTIRSSAPTINDLKQTGSSRFNPIARDIQERTPDLNSRTEKTGGFLNLFRWVWQTRKAGQVNTRIFGNRCDNRETVEQHGDDTRAQVSQCSTELSSIETDRHRETRAKKTRRAAGDYDESSAMDTIKIVDHPVRTPGISWTEPFWVSTAKGVLA